MLGQGVRPHRLLRHIKTHIRDKTIEIFDSRVRCACAENDIHLRKRKCPDTYGILWVKMATDKNLLNEKEKRKMRTNDMYSIRCTHTSHRAGNAPPKQWKPFISFDSL